MRGTLCPAIHVHTYAHMALSPSDQNHHHHASGNIKFSWMEANGASKGKSLHFHSWPSRFHLCVSRYPFVVLVFPFVSLVSLVSLLSPCPPISLFSFRSLVVHTRRT